ncbi:Synaptonemal complex protein 2 [Liparis tanakae]|uniref:Synaptonemal complex protein 2 n=1 Tax=Liparis tanakae TaxID=230148 RepID=A0A4Z2JC00_9TELE|nr:Synaptonemal complex protein 2 [Liparis tanakae]
MVEVYNKHSLKTVQQHVSCLNTQVTKYRTQRLEQVQKVLMEEINQLEKDDTVLTSMERDLTIYWKKQSVAFHSYREQGTVRNEALKKALRTNVCHSVEYEEKIFTSQMCMIRNDMKSAQDRLLSEMMSRVLEQCSRRAEDEEASGSLELSAAAQLKKMLKLSISSQKKLLAFMAGGTWRDKRAEEPRYELSRGQPPRPPSASTPPSIFSSFVLSG